VIAHDLLRQDPYVTALAEAGQAAKLLAGRGLASGSLPRAVWRL
jgi:hypothetical protein